MLVARLDVVYGLRKAIVRDCERAQGGVHPLKDSRTLTASYDIGHATLILVSRRHWAAAVIQVGRW
jgi:hypothetical protein